MRQLICGNFLGVCTNNGILEGNFAAADDGGVARIRNTRQADGTQVKLRFEILQLQRELSHGDVRGVVGGRRTLTTGGAGQAAGYGKGGTEAGHAETGDARLGKQPASTGEV